MSRLVVARLISAVLLLASALAPARVFAGGLEYTAAGATALGRGGAVTARADDPMVLSYNPAGLVELRGSQLLLDTNMALMSACVDPIGFYGWGVYDGGGPSAFTDPNTGKREVLNLGQPDATTGKIGAAEQRYYEDALDTVCMEQHVVPIPQLIVTSRLSEDFGIGGGFVFPAISPSGQWGDQYGQVRGDTGGLRPAATRYMLMNTGNLGVFPTIAAAYRITKWLRVGAAFEWGIIWVDSTQMAGVGTGTAPSNDLIAHIRARDLFIPALTASVHLVPTDSLDIVAAFRYQDEINAPGHLDTTTGIFGANAVRRVTHDLEVTSVQQKMPWKLRGGIRYSDRLVPRPSGTGGTGEGGLYDQPLQDYFADELWDIELDVEYQMNARNKEQVVKYRENQAVEFEDTTGNIMAAGFPDFTVPDTRIQKHWKDQISVRAGGSYNVLPGLFGVMGGAHYETRGIDPSYMQIDFWPVSRVGLHAGVTFRLMGTTDIVFSFAHIFQETITVSAPQHELAASIYQRYAPATPGAPRGEITTIDKTVGTKIARTDVLQVIEEKKPANVDGEARLTQVTQKVAKDQPPWIINSGTYRSSMNVIAIGLHAHF